MLGLILLMLTPFLALMWIMGVFHEKARIANSRQHFSRPSFSAWVDKEGKWHIKGGEDLDHSTRCINSLNAWYTTEKRIRWYPLIWAGIVSVALVLGI